MRLPFFTAEYLLTILLAAAALSILQQAAAESEEKKPAVDYEKLLQRMAGLIEKSNARTEKLVNEQLNTESRDPGSQITRESMAKLMRGSVFLPQKSGTRTISLQGSQGFNGINNYQPAGWKIVESMKGPPHQPPPPSPPKDPGFTYPTGLGPALMNGCTEKAYPKSSPCYRSRLPTQASSLCPNMISSAMYIGAGFNGRGYYRAESRRASVIQRLCLRKGKYFMQDVPDTMNVMGIYETKSEIRSFQSVGGYMKYIRQKAGLSNQKTTFMGEASKYVSSILSGENIGAIGAIAGGVAGAAAGGPAGAAIGSTLGGVIGTAISSSKSSDKSSETSSSKEEEPGEKRKKKTTSSTNKFFAMMYCSVILYEITLDEVKPKDVNMATLRDYMNLPPSYFTIGSAAKYQNFLVRWGTHYIRSGKFGGQLRITKTSKTSKIKTVEKFSRVAEAEFKSMFSTLQSQFRQASAAIPLLGGKSSSEDAPSDQEPQGMKEKGEAKSSTESTFTQTSVDAQGGAPEIAEAIVDFYTPAFKQIFHDWLGSIKDYPKPFEFQLSSIDDLFNMNMDELFPSGEKDFGCVGSKKSGLKTYKEKGTNKRFYMDTRVTEQNGTISEEKFKVYCKYNQMSDFKEDLQKRRISLERAVSVYMAEGPFPTSSLDLKGGEPGCEEVIHSRLSASASASHTILRFGEMKRKPFLLAFDMPQSVKGIIAHNSKFRIVHRSNRWFATNPKSRFMHLYDGCQLLGYRSTSKKICFQNIILTYEEKTGLFSVDPRDFELSRKRIPSLPDWLSGSTVARARRITAADTTGPTSAVVTKAAQPCQVRWFNSHRLDPSKQVNCVHFTAASRGDIFVIFAAVPRDKDTWYYLQISFDGASFYKAMHLKKQDIKKGMGVLGDENLFQSFFACVIQYGGTVTMQYGKAEADSEIGKVHSAYTFPREGEPAHLTFYTFGAGTSPVSLMDIRLTKQMPNVTCLGEQYEKKGSHCVLRCHPECSGCDGADDNSMCHQCKHLRVVTGIDASQQVRCYATCPPGHFQPSNSSAICVKCSSGTFKSSAGNHQCKACPEGKLSSAGAIECHDCNGGHYSTGTSCFDCPAGTFSNKGDPNCTLCPKGTFSLTASPKCNPCVIGHFSNSTGAVSCEPCPEWYMAPEKGLSSCVRCPDGSWAPPRSGRCTVGCPEGYFSPRAGVKCQVCPPGHFAKSSGALACTPCPKGTYQPQNQSISCINASKGSFVASEGSSQPEPCPPGSYSGQEGTSSCIRCNDTSASPREGAIECSSCPHRHISSLNGTQCMGKVISYECYQYKANFSNCSSLIDAQRNDDALGGGSACFEKLPARGRPAEVSVYLTTNRTISRVAVWNRIKCCGNTVDQISVSIGYRDNRQACRPYLGNGVEAKDKFNHLVFDCDGESEVVNVATENDVKLSLCEIEVYDY